MFEKAQFFDLISVTHKTFIVQNLILRKLNFQIWMKDKIIVFLKSILLGTLVVLTFAFVAAISVKITYLVMRKPEKIFNCEGRFCQKLALS